MDHLLDLLVNKVGIYNVIDIWLNFIYPFKGLFIVFNSIAIIIKTLIHSLPFHLVHKFAKTNFQLVNN